MEGGRRRGQEEGKRLACSVSSSSKYSTDQKVQRSATVLWSVRTAYKVQQLHRVEKQRHEIAISHANRSVFFNRFN